MILIEPGMLSREIWDVVFKEPTVFNKVMEMTKRGKSNWPSKEAAKQWFSKRTPWKTWDAKAFNLMMVSPAYNDPHIHSAYMTSLIAIWITRFTDRGLSKFEGGCYIGMYAGPRSSSLRLL